MRLKMPEGDIVHGEKEGERWGGGGGGVGRGWGGVESMVPTSERLRCFRSLGQANVTRCRPIQSLFVSFRISIWEGKKIKLNNLISK